MADDQVIRALNEREAICSVLYCLYISVKSLDVACNVKIWEMIRDASYRNRKPSDAL